MSSSSGDITRFYEQKDSGSGSGSYQRHPMAGSRSSPPLDSGRSRQSPSMPKLIAQNHQFVPQSSSVTMPNLPPRIDNQGDGRASNVSSLLIRASMNIKCYCSKQETRADFMVICENCHTWQHGLCVGIYETPSTPYLCKSCRPSGFPRRWIKSVDDSLLVNEFIKATRLWPQLFTKRAFQGGFKLKHNVGCTEDTVLVKLKEQMKAYLLNADLDVGTRIRLHFHARIPPTDELKEFLNARGYLRVDIRGAMTAFYSRADEIFDFPPKIDIQQLPWFPMKCEANLMAPITVQGSHPPGIMTSSQPKQPRPSQTVPRAPMDSHPTHPLPNVVMNGMTPPSGQTMNNAGDFHQMSIGDFFRMTRATPTGPMAPQTLSKNDHQQQIAQQNSMGSNRDCHQSMSISASHVPSTSQVNHRNTVSAQMQPAISRVPDPMSHSHRYQDRDRSRDSAKTTLSKNEHQQQTTRQDPGASSRYRYQPTPISASHVPPTSQVNHRNTVIAHMPPAVSHGPDPATNSHKINQDRDRSRDSAMTTLSKNEHQQQTTRQDPGASSRYRYQPTTISASHVPSTSQDFTQIQPAVGHGSNPTSHSHRYQDLHHSSGSSNTIPRPASFSPPGHRHHPRSILTTNVPSTSQGGTVSAQMPPAISRVPDPMSHSHRYQDRDRSRDSAKTTLSKNEHQQQTTRQDTGASSRYRYQPTISRVPDPMSHSHRYQDRDRSRDSAFTGSTSLSPPAQMPQFQPPTPDLKGPSSKNLDSIGRPIKREVDDKEASLEFQRNAKRKRKESEAVKYSNPKLTTGQFLGQLEMFLQSLATGNSRIVDFINQVRLRREGQNEFQRDEITYAEIYSHLKSIFKTMRNHTQKIRPSEPETELEIVFDPLLVPLKKFLEKLNVFVGTFKMYYGDFQKLEEEILKFASGVSEDMVIEVETIPQRLHWIYDQYGLI
ncbi:unnamed protein product [Caenorhabditis nigoni]